MVDGWYSMDPRNKEMRPLLGEGRAVCWAGGLLSGTDIIEADGVPEERRGPCVSKVGSRY